MLLGLSVFQLALKRIIFASCDKQTAVKSFANMYYLFYFTRALYSSVRPASGGNPTVPFCFSNFGDRVFYMLVGVFRYIDENIKIVKSPFDRRPQIYRVVR